MDNKDIIYRLKAIQQQFHYKNLKLAFDGFKQLIKDLENED